MINNDILRSIRYMLDLSDIKVVEIAKMSSPELVLDKEDMKSILEKEGSEGFAECSDAVLAHFLDGLIVYRRGKDDRLPQRSIEKRITNNLVLKKLRVAFELKDEDMHSIFAEVDFPVTKPELSALFRQSGHKHYRPCGDQMLRNFLKGLTVRLRGA